MSVLRKAIGMRREPLHQRKKLAFVALQLRRRSSADVGIALWHRGHAVWPWKRKP